MESKGMFAVSNSQTLSASTYGPELLIACKLWLFGMDYQGHDRVCPQLWLSGSARPPVVGITPVWK